jgi:DegV family protein with EDD domain
LPDLINKIDNSQSGTLKVKIITDSTIDLDPELLRSLDVSVVPIYIRFGDRVFQDGVNITKREFYQLLKSSPVHPATSQPPPEDFARCYVEAMKTSDGIISIHVSSRISGTVNSANMAKKIMGKAFPLEVIDSQFNSAGLGLVVKTAANLAQKGAMLPEVLAETHKVINQVHMFGMFETMKYLALSGRVNKAIVAAANFLNVKPMLTFKDGEIIRAGLVRTISRGMDRIVEFAKARTPLREITIVHSNIPDQAQELKKRLSGLIEKELISITELGAALGVHGGPGVLVLALRTY